MGASKRRVAGRDSAAQVIEPPPVVQLAGAAVHAVGEGQFVAGWLPVQHDAAARAGRHRLRRGDALPAPWTWAPAPNSQAFEWGLDTSGELKELEQKVRVGTDQNKQEVEARFEGNKNQTTIKLEQSPQELVTSGLALLRLATARGQLAVEFRPDRRARTTGDLRVGMSPVFCRGSKW